MLLLRIYKLLVDVKYQYHRSYQMRDLKTKSVDNINDNVDSNLLTKISFKQYFESY